jgi:miniconductance mechanosensitive channel
MIDDLGAHAPDLLRKGSKASAVDGAGHTRGAVPYALRRAGDRAARADRRRPLPGGLDRNETPATPDPRDKAMIPQFITDWLDARPLNQAIAVAVGAMLSWIIARFVVARGMVWITSRTENKWDDIFIEHLRPHRLAWIAPLVVFNQLAYRWPDSEGAIRSVTLFLVVWIGVRTLISLLTAINLIYESRLTYTGVSIQGYLDLGKMFFVLVGVIISVSGITGESPVLLLSGLGAITAILLLIFHDTILSLVASVQIMAHDLVRENDWIEVPSFNADGDVKNISLHSIQVQNFDKTFTVIPTHKLKEVSYKNWRGMSESGGRRIKRAILLDIQSIRFCNAEVLARLERFDLLKDYIAGRSWSEEDSSLPRSTNVGAFMAYIDLYVRSRDDIREDMTVIVRHLDPGPNGLPVEIYIFTNTTVWEKYEAIQASIFDHLLAVLPEFGLRVFQRTGVLTTYAEPSVERGL